MFARNFLTRGILRATLFVAVAVFLALTPNPAFSGSLENWWAATGSSFTVDYVAGTISSPGIRDVGNEPWLESWGRSEVNVNNNSFNLLFTLSAPQKERIRIFHAEPYQLYVEKTVVVPAGARRIRLDCFGVVDAHAVLDVEHGFPENVGDAVLISAVDLREVPAIRVTSPDGGETLVAGPVSVAWTAESSVTKVNIDLVSDGVPMARLATGVSGSNFTWELDPHWPAGTRYRVRIRAADGSGAFDDSNSDFAIAGESKIIVERPTAGAVVTRGEQTTLRWRFYGLSAGTARVALFKGKVRVAILAKSAPFGEEGIGLFVWSVPADLAPGTDYRIKVVAGGKAGRGPAFKIE